MATLRTLRRWLADSVPKAVGFVPDGFPKAAGHFSLVN
jgi:hypothetical protein